jgi:multiple sugar transport system substrate-binding protein
MKNIVKTLMVTAAVLLISMNLFAGGSASSEGAQEVLVWGWMTDYLNTVGGEFAKTHPQYRVINEAVASTDTITRFNSAIASGGKLPDVLSVESYYTGIILSNDYNGLIEDLRKAPYNVNPNDILDWVVDSCTSFNGELRGVEQGPAPSTLAYTKSVARQYFGTDDPQQLYSQLDSWNKVLEAGRRLKTASNGQKYLATDISQFSRVMLMEGKKPTVQNGKIVIRRTWKETFDFLSALEREGLVRDLTEPAAVADAMANHPDLYLLWQCAMWQPRWAFMTSAPNQIGTFATLPTLPGGVMAIGGGTFLCIPGKAQNKTGGFEFIKWLRLSTEGSVFTRDYAGDVSSLKKDYSDPNFHKSPKDLLDYFGGFDIVAQFASLVSRTTSSYKTEYDPTIWTSCLNLALQAIRTGKSSDEALSIAADELKRVYPGLSE